MVTASERRTHASERVIAPELQDLLLTHQGKWVAMTKTKLLAVGDSPDEVLHGAAELGERRPILYFVPRNGHTKLFF